MFELVISVSWCSPGFSLKTMNFSYIHKCSSDGLESTNKLFADDGSLFSTVYDPNMSAYQLDKDLKKIFQNGNTNGK